MRQLVLKSGKYLFFFILILLINSSCDEIEYNIPDVPVYWEANINQVGMDLQGTYYLPGLGYGGVIIYCAGQIGDRYEFYAFDATCTHEVNRTCLTLKDEKIDNKLCPCNLSSFIVTCECCDSKFNLGDGSGHPIDGPATLPLRPYKTTFFGNILRVYND